MKNIKFYILITLGILLFFLGGSGELYNIIFKHSTTDKVEFSKRISENDPACLQMQFYIKKYAAEYDIPLDYAYGLAYQETGYRGIFHWRYNHKQTSPVGAVGPMQIMPATAEWMEGKEVNVKKLREDIELNVRISMKLLRYLKDKYGDWKLVFGCYNTGRPCINEYANNIYNLNYTWDK